jgi:hypothetical protein
MLPKRLWIALKNKYRCNLAFGELKQDLSIYNNLRNPEHSEGLP